MTDLAYNIANLTPVNAHMWSPKSTTDSGEQRKLSGVAIGDDLRYSYQGLRQGTFIRLLNLHPGSGSDQIRCSLKEVDLGDDPGYDAISYCWGDASETEVLCCGGSAIRVTRNLCDALARVRRLDAKTMIRIDAICINQKDLEEVNRQVQLMGRIYKQARQCMVWLGPSTDKDALAFDLLSTLDHFRPAQPHEQKGEQLHPDRTRSVFTTPEEWEALSMLLARPWFGRLWTLQEIVLAQHAILMVGPFTFNASSFYFSMLYMQSSELSARLTKLEGGYLHSLKVAALREDMKTRSVGMDLLDILRNARDRLTSDPRDKVMGVLGLCENQDEWSGALGYHMTTCDIYISIAIHLLSTLDPLRVFSACSAFRKTASQCRNPLPTWVPDWSQRVVYMPCMQAFEKQAYSAGASSLPAFRCSNSPYNLYTIAVRGAMVTKIEDFLDMRSETFHQDFLKALGDGRSATKQTREQFFVEQCGRLAGDSSTVDRYLAFCRTMECSLNESASREAANRRLHLGVDRRQYQQDGASLGRENNDLLRDFVSWTQERKFAVMDDGSIGWIPHEAQVGDVVCVFQGAKFPYVLREMSDTAAFGIVGHCFVHGIMNGELWSDASLRTTDIVLT